MEWRGRRGSKNIEDHRTARSSTRRVGGAGKAGGVGGVGLIVVLVVGYFLGFDVSGLLQDPSATASAPATAELTQADRDIGQFVSVTLADTEEVWVALFRQQLNRAYRPVVLKLYRGSVGSPCGDASGATGPFYCPSDRKVYLDTDFFTTMDQRLGAKGDFAAAYVVAHEVAHHVQNELGILGKAHQLRAQSSQTESNEISVRIELQADCLAGIWAGQAQQQFGSIQKGDFEEVLNAALQIGDDTLAKNAGRKVMPHTFTHGTSAQRAKWFLTGLNSGQMADCDTFSARRL
ncbi:MAG: KPN_02809 family neutral zinc metallopeptidase [Paracoccaceae bacterium]